jgi:hypothetical protein
MSKEIRDSSYVPQEVAVFFERADLEDTLALTAAFEKYNARLEKLRERYQRELKSLGTYKQWAKYQRLHKRRISIMKELREKLDGTPEPLSKYSNCTTLICAS